MYIQKSLLNIGMHKSQLWMIKIVSVPNRKLWNHVSEKCLYPSQPNICCEGIKYIQNVKLFWIIILKVKWKGNIPTTI